MLKKWASPEVGLIKDVRIFRVVLFPAPFGPRKAKAEPLGTSKERLSTAVISSKVFVRSLIVIAFGIIVFDVGQSYKLGVENKKYGN